jgi:hypothetical protein
MVLTNTPSNPHREPSWKYKQKHVIVAKSKLPGGRTPIFSTSYSSDAKLVAAGGQDGALWLWNSNGPFINPVQVPTAYSHT